MALLPATSLAGKAEAESAMTEIMFDSDQIRPEEIIYKVSKNGVVNVTFDDDLPENLKDEFIAKLRAHPGINGANIKSEDICFKVLR